MTKRTVVTGGAGVIGQELVAMLAARGDHVRVVDRLPRPEAFGPEIDYVQGDLVDLHPSAISSADPHVIHHLAAAFERSEENPEFWLQNAHDNVVASQRVLAAACASPSLERYVFASSYLVYDPSQFLVDEPPEVPICLDEDSLIDPRNACGAAKLLHEKEAHLAAEAPDQGFTVVSARIYRVYGRSSRDVVSRWIRAALRGDEVTLFGSESFFDYIHARDVARGLLELASATVEGPVNLGSGHSQRVSTMVDNIVTHFPDFRVDGPHPADTYEASQADVGRLEAVTGWRPAISLEEGVADLVAHEREAHRLGAVRPRVDETEEAAIMISSVSRKAPLIKAAREALESASMTGGVDGADADAAVPTRSLLDRFWHMGRLDRISDDEILERCQDLRVTVLLPTRDGELRRYAELRDRLASVGTFVPIGSPESVDGCLDKLLTAQRCADAGVAVPATADRVDDIEGGRLVVKDRYGAGSRSLAVDVDRAGAETAAEAMATPVFQAFEPGPEFSIDAYVDRGGAIIGTVVRERVLVVNGEAQVTRTVDRVDIDEVARAALNALDVRGHAVVQVIDGASGPVLIEVNSRVGGASAAAFAAGLRSIEYMLAEAAGRKVEPVGRLVAPLEMTRLPVDTVVHR